MVVCQVWTAGVWIQCHQWLMGPRIFIPVSKWSSKTSLISGSVLEVAMKSRLQAEICSVQAFGPTGSQHPEVAAVSAAITSLLNSGISPSYVQSSSVIQCSALTGAPRPHIGSVLTARCARPQLAIVFHSSIS